MTLKLKRQSILRTLFLQIACRNGLTPEWFKERFRVLPLGGANFAGAVIQWTDSNPDNAFSLAD
jgi:hypothetical protein